MNYVCPPVPKASNPPTNLTWEDAIMPPSLKLSRTFSTYGIPAFEETANYLLFGGTIPSIDTLREGVYELKAQMERPGFYFTAEQMSRWIDMKILVNA